MNQTIDALNNILEYIELNRHSFKNDFEYEKIKIYVRSLKSDLKTDNESKPHSENTVCGNPCPELKTACKKCTDEFYTWRENGLLGLGYSDEQREKMK